jgi:hypothetical protein
MGTTALAGLAVTAHNNATNCAAAFDNVSVNQPPVLAPISSQSLRAGQVLTLTNSATDPDIPAQTLSYNLLAAPAGAAVSTNTGLFTWRPALAQSPSTQTVTLVVSDSGLPVMSATQSFRVIVSRPAPPTLSATASPNGPIGLWLNGDAGPDYTIQVSTNLTVWSSIATIYSPALPCFWADTNSGSGPLRFYRALLGP